MSNGPMTSRARRMAKLGRVAGGQGARHLAMMTANLARSEEQAELALEKRQLELAEQLVTVLGTMRGAAMKVGQMLSIVDFGLIPADHRDEFQKKLSALQDRAPNVPFKKMQKQIERELGGSINSIFSDFESEPVNAASIGQVYRATLRDGGRQVAVKVQYPGIDEAVRADIKNLRFFAKAAKKIIPGIDVEAVIAEVEERVFEELDYEHEASNHRFFARHYRGHPFIRVPEVHSSLCTDHVLVTDWVDGKPMAYAETLDQDTRNHLAEIVFRFYMGGPYELLLFTGDPHPGNSLILPDNTVAFLDFGLLKRISRHAADQELAAGRAIAEGDAEALFERFAEQGVVLDRERISPQDLLEGVMLTQGWFLADAPLKLTPKLTNRIAAYASDLRGPIYRIFRDQPLPPEHMVQRRVEIQVLSILGQLHPELNWGRIAYEWTYGDEPETELGKQAKAWRDGSGLTEPAVPAA